MEKRAYDSDEGPFDGPDLIAPVRKKMALISQEVKNVKGQDPLRIAPPVEDSLFSPGTRSNVGNYMDCTKSNNDDEMERQLQWEEQLEIKHGTKDEREEETAKRNGESYERVEREEKTTKEEVKNEERGEEDRKEAPSTAPPRWEDFFTSETLTDTQNSQSQSYCPLTGPSPRRMTGGSQTPELFSEDDEEAELTSSQSTNLSNQALSDQDTPMTDTLIIHPEQRVHQWEGIESQSIQSEPGDLSASNKASSDEDTSMTDTLIIQPEERRREQGELVVRVHQGEEFCSQIVQSETGVELSESQASSDFDIPCTPESHPPSPEELAQLYRKLASGEELVIGKGGHGKDA